MKKTTEAKRMRCINFDYIVLPDLSAVHSLSCECVECFNISISDNLSSNELQAKLIEDFFRSLSCTVIHYNHLHLRMEIRILSNIRFRVSNHEL